MEVAVRAEVAPVRHRIKNRPITKGCIWLMNVHLKGIQPYYFSMIVLYISVANVGRSVINPAAPCIY